MKTIETSGFSERLNVSIDGIIANGVVDAFNVNARQYRPRYAAP